MHLAEAHGSHTVGKMRSFTHRDLERMQAVIEYVVEPTELQRNKKLRGFL